MEDYPAFAPVGVELKAMNETIAGMDTKIDTKIAESEQRTSQRTQHEARQREERDEMAQLNKVHPGWVKDVGEDQFKDWALDGGPSKEGYNRVVQLSQAAQQEGKTSPEADTIVATWRDAFPDWWQSRGSNLFGDIQGSITLLNQYKGKEDLSSLSGDELTDADLRRKKRLASTTTVDGKSGRAAAGKNDKEAFKSGFDKVMKSRVGA